jgi:hypothetical protein
MIIIIILFILFILLSIVLIRYNLKEYIEGGKEYIEGGKEYIEWGKEYIEGGKGYCVQDKKMFENELKEYILAEVVKFNKIIFHFNISHWTI